MRVTRDQIGAVDFGSSAIRVLIARKEGDGAVQIIGHGAAPSSGCVSQGVIQDLAAAKLAFRQALQAAEKEARTRVATLYCGINGRNVETFIREGSVQLPKGVVESSDMAEAAEAASRDVEAQGKSLSSYLTAQEWYLDELRVLNPIGIHAHTLKTRIHFARVPSLILDNIIACVESQGRELEDVVFLPLASALGCLTPEDMELGVAVLDMGRSTTGLAVYRDHRILGTHSFEWGGYHITRDVAAGLRISFDEADELVLEYGISEEYARSGQDVTAGEISSSNDDDHSTRIKLKTVVPGAPTIVPRRELDGIVYDRAKELVAKVRQHLQARGLLRNLVRGVVLTGGAGALRNYTSLAEAVFQVPCRVGTPSGVQFVCQAADFAGFTAAAGIARHAFAVRAASRNGHTEVTGPVGAAARRFGRFVRKYIA